MQRPWTDADDATLDYLWNVAGRRSLDVEAVAERLGRSVKAILCRVQRRGWRHPRNTSRPWTTPEDAEADRLWTVDGLTAAEIGLRLGRSRNSVISRLGRLGLSPLPQPRPRLPRRRRPPRDAVAALPPRPKPPPPGPGPLEWPQARPWVERLAGQCAFPVRPDGADTLSCCNPTYGFLYCPGHEALMRPAPKPGQGGR